MCSVLPSFLQSRLDLAFNARKSLASEHYSTRRISHLRSEEKLRRIKCPARPRNAVEKRGREGRRVDGSSTRRQDWCFICDLLTADERQPFAHARFTSIFLSDYTITLPSQPSRARLFHGSNCASPLRLRGLARPCLSASRVPGRILCSTLSGFVVLPMPCRSTSAWPECLTALKRPTARRCPTSGYNHGKHQSTPPCVMIVAIHRREEPIVALHNSAFTREQKKIQVSPLSS